MITGSTRGIGFGLAQAFLARSCRVMISGSRRASVEPALEKLSAEAGSDRLFGLACDVTDFNQVQALWDAARAQFGRVDIWISNAGISHLREQFWKLAPETIAAVVGTNVIGGMYSARVALPGLLEQGGGAFYIMEGMGSDGRRRTPGLDVYGTTKYALRYLTRALVEEVKDTPVIVGALSPGMVLTDMVLDEYRARPDSLKEAKNVLNILMDRVETVAPWLADQVLANKQNGARIRWLTGPKLMARFLLAPFKRRDLFTGEIDDPADSLKD